MKKLSMIFLFFALNAMADDYCYCDIYAMAPLSGSRSIEPLKISRKKMSYYTNYGIVSQNSCVSECQLKVLSDLSSFQQDLERWSVDLVKSEQHGRHCTGPTNLKIPIRAKARIGRNTIGLAHEAFMFVHLNDACNG
jgi:hypothetical protein